MRLSKRRRETIAEMDMTPMIDCTFQLLIFFIVTMKFKTLEKKLFSYLPTDFGTNASSAIVDEMFITVKIEQKKDSTGAIPIRERDSYFYVETEEIKGASDVEIIGKIATRVADFKRTNKDAKGKIHASVGVPHKRVVAILDAFHKAGYDTITFVGLTVNKNMAESDAWWIKIRKELGD